MKQKQRIINHGWKGLIYPVLLLGIIAAAVLPIQAATAPAGSIIGNRASATYNDSNGQPRSVLSNMVTTVVQQVAALDLQASMTKFGAAGSQVVFPVTLTNNGNGPDTFALAVSDVNAMFEGITLYADLDGNGIADNDTAIASSGPVAAGAIYKFVAVATVKNTASGTGTFKVNATSGLTASLTKFVTDTVTVTTKALVNVTKAVDIHSGPPSDASATPAVDTIVTYTLRYTNIGNAEARNLTLEDTIPNNMTYVPGSARWSNLPNTTALTDDVGAPSDDQNGIIYQFNNTAKTLTAVIANVPGGTSSAGWLTFKVRVNDSAPAGTIINYAQFKYYDTPGVDTYTTYFKTNEVPFVVTQFAKLTFTGETKDAPASPGETIKYNNTLTNTGNGTDTFDITINTGDTYPTGTTFLLCKSDGETPLVDTNGNGIVDSGPLAPGGSCIIVLKVTLPTYIAIGKVPPYSVFKNARSTFDSTKSADAEDKLTALSRAAVDITVDKSITGGADASNGLGLGSVNTGSKKTAATDPGVSKTFNLFVNNTAAISDSYNLQVSTAATFATLGPPNGFTVQFIKDGSTIITNTGVVPGNGVAPVSAIVTPSASVVPGIYELYFRALSPTTLVADYIQVTLTVNQYRKITIAPDYTGQVTPGGSLVFSHIITNNGNVLEGDTTHSTSSLTLAQTAGFSGGIYWDKNNNGALDIDDIAINDLSTLTGGLGGASTDAGLEPGEWARIFLKIYAPASATVGTISVTTLTVTTSQGTYTPTISAVFATDTITVIAGQLSVLKEQALDANGDGIPDTAYSQNPIENGAIPGAYIRYKITVTNNGAERVTGVTVTDAIPQFTEYDSAHAATCTHSDTTATPAISTAGGKISVSGFDLKPGEKVIIMFQVKISQ
jgi:uncharacterized repeat protein (TIGR01451 family)